MLYHGQVLSQIHHVVLAGLNGNLLSAKDEYRAKLLTAGGPVSDKAINILISIESYSTAEEIKKLFMAWNTSDPNAFFAEFRALDKGLIRIMGTRGLNLRINAAQIQPAEKGEKVLICTESQSWQLGSSKIFYGEFPFAVVELEIDAKGKGTGKVFENAKVRFGNDGSIVFESYRMPPLQLVFVNRQK